MVTVQDDTTKPGAPSVAGLSRDVNVPKTAPGNTGMRFVDHNPNAIITGVQMIFGTVDKGRQIMNNRLGNLADSGPNSISGSYQRQSYQQLRNDAEYWRTEHGKAIQYSKTLNVGLEQKEKQLRETQNQLHTIIQQNESLAKDLAEKNDRFRETYTQLLMAREKETVMRAILLENTSTNRVNDDEIKDKFLSIRQKAQAISNSSAYDLEMLDPTVWGHLTIKDRRNRMMSHIFNLLQYRIFDTKVFCQYEPTHDSCDPSCSLAMEAWLAHIEATFEHNNINKALLANWRVATIDCLSELIGPSPRSRMVAPAMFAHFVPVISPKSGTKQQGELQKQFQSICDEAWDLAILMRRSREGYKCIVPPTGRSKCFINAYETLVEPITVEGGKNEDRSDEIAYSLFGALVKGANHEESKGGVLEKAQVVLKRR
ncbi:hypothetical protein S40293_10817 [Stachybotrys chartarum IBT 40293]|nr:hypothetical protein S40293_10817 [Stachybotrys chartarum IBT 40293]